MPPENNTGTPIVNLPDDNISTAKKFVLDGKVGDLV
jgi:hypothetical protein